MAYPPNFTSQAQYEAFLAGTLSPAELAALPSLPSAQTPVADGGLPPEFAPPPGPPVQPQRPVAPPQRPQAAAQAPQRPGPPQRPAAAPSPLEMMNQIGATYHNFLTQTTWPGMTVVLNFGHDKIHAMLVDVGASGEDEPQMIAEQSASPMEMGALFEHMLACGQRHVADQTAQVQAQPQLQPFRR